MEISGLSPEDWDDTKRLINIYGIACGMSYLHAHNILHRDLKPENILMNDYLYPLISDFGLSKITDFLSISMNIQSQKGLKGTPIYMAPEILSTEEYSKSGDVYSFAFIVYEIMTRKRPFENKEMNIYQLIKKISIEGYRPDIDDDVPNTYKMLIQNCWSQKAEDRPSFDDIIHQLKNNDDFLTELTDKLEFYDYVDYIENYKTTFDTDNRRLRFADFIMAKGRNKTLKAVSLKKINVSDENEEIDSYSESQEMNPQNKQDINISNPVKESSSANIDLISNPQKITENSSAFDITSNPQKITENSSALDINSNPQKITETDLIDSNVKETNSSESIGLYPIFQYHNLNEKCHNIVNRVIKEPEQQFIVGKSLIEEKNDFSQNIYLGLKYIEQSLNEKCANSILYYAQMLIKGDIISQNFEKAEQYLSTIPQDKRILVLKGKICRKKTKYSEAVKYFKEGSKAGDKESMFEYGKMLFIGEGVKKNINEAMKYFNLSIKQGHKKSENFINIFNKMKDMKGFLKLPTESQLFFITNNIKNIDKQNNLEFNEIIFSPHKTEKLYFNKSLKSSYFHDCINAYNNIYFQIKYPSTSFKMTNDLVTKIKSKFVSKNIQIDLVLTSFDVSIKNSPYIKIDKSIHIIPKEAFLNCSLLTQIIIPSSVTEIGDSSFCGCSSLKQITIPSSVTSIGYGAFSKCSSLMHISIPSSITLIGDNCFDHCEKLNQLKIPHSVTSIGNSAFESCYSLREIIIPSSVTSIGKNAFMGCSSLTQITIPSSVTKIDNSVFECCSSLTQITIPSFVTSIEDKAFKQCSKLTQITIPSSVTLIGKNAFNGCSSLTQITIPSSITSISDSSFFGCSSLAQITIPSSVISIEKSAFSVCSSLTQITIPSSVTSIGKYVFSGCSSLKQITIPSSVTSFGDHIFDGIKLLEIRGDIHYFSKILFSYCRSLTQIKIPFSVTSIGNNTFSYCSSLTQITIPSSVTSIGDDAFSGCIALTNIEFEMPSSLKSIGKNCFHECQSLIRLIIPSSVTLYELQSFKGFKNLTQITIPSFITSIGDNGFNGCSSLTQIIIPSSVASIGNYAFEGCLSLTQITIPSSVTAIGEYAFEGCSSFITNNNSFFCSFNWKFCF